MLIPVQPNSIAIKSLKIFFLFLLVLPLHLQAQDSLATIYFYRVGKFAGSLVGYDIRQGDQVIGRIKSNSMVAFHGKAGEYTFSAKTESESSIRLILEAGKTYYVECGIAVGVVIGKPTFRQVGTAEAKKEIAAIDATVANSIIVTSGSAPQPSDTIRALHNLFQRKRKGGTTRAIVFGTIGIFGLINASKTSTVTAPNGQVFDVSESSTGAYLGVGLSGLIMVLAMSGVIT
jgi:hypothetical protein